MKFETPEDYILKPWFLKLDYLQEIENNKIMQAFIIVGITGQGKTFLTAKKIVTDLFKNRNQRLVIISAPTNGILSTRLFKTFVDGLGIDVTEDLNEAVYLLRMAPLLASGGKVLVITNNHALTQQKGKDLIEYANENLPFKFTTIIDEAHSWLVPDPSLYKDDRGHGGYKYKASLYKLLCTLKTNHIFALTATPTNSQMGKISHDGKLQFKIINELPPKELMIDRLGCLGNVEYYNPEIVLDMARNNGSCELIRKVTQMLKNMKEIEEKTGCKQTMLIRTGTTSSKNIMTYPHMVRDTMDKLVKSVGYDTDEMIYGITNQTGQTIESISGNRQTVPSDEMLQYYFDDPNHSVRIMLVIDKCYQGMSVNSIKNVVIWRTSSAEDSSGDPIIDFAIQTFGRGVRPYAGIHKLENHTFDSLKHLPLEEKENIVELNTLNILSPNLTQLKTSMAEFQNNYISSKEEFAKYFLETNLNDEEEELDEELCTQCGGTGIQPKKNFVDDTDFSGVENELMI